MLEPLEQENMPYFKTLSKKQKGAFLTLLIENICLYSWRIIFWILMFCGLWMLNIPSFFGQVISVIFSLIFVIGLVYLIKKDLLSFKMPIKDDVIKILESHNNLPRGQISILSDELANPQEEQTRKLWKQAQKNILKSLSSLKSPRSRYILSRNDPHALRFIAIIVFISGFLVAGNDWKSRIYQGVIPININKIAIYKKNDISLWIKPPEYTQIEPIHLTNKNKINNDEIIKIPEGSKIRVRLYSFLGKNFPPIFYNGDKKIEMSYLGSNIYSIETTIKNGNNIKIKQGPITKAKWKYKFIVDTPPKIYLPQAKKENQKPYEIMDKGQLRFPLIVKDDYGVKNLHMTMNIDKMVEDFPLGDNVKNTRLIMSRPNEEFKISPVYDLTWHTWAGLPVTFKYIVNDHKGQNGTLNKVISLTLPERKFKHPMARSIISMRKKLAWDYSYSNFVDISKNLEILLSSPDYFQSDIAIYLSIRSAASRLFYSEKYKDEERKQVALEVINLLWNVAIAIEDGNLSIAIKELRAAQQALENALNDPNSTDSEIAKIMDNLREKMANYFMELQREIQKNMAKNKHENDNKFPNISPEDFGQIISADTISKLMQQIENALKSGNNQKAQELMSQLQRMMDVIDPSISSQLPQDMQAMRQGINELEKLIENQEKLLNKTIISSPMPTKEEQEALRYILGQLMLDIGEKLDEIPEKMGMAEQEMRLSENALDNYTPDASIPHQELVIEHLKEAQESLNNSFKQRMKQMIGIGFNAGVKRDPLGRRIDNSSDVKIPDQTQKKHLDEILKILRERSGDLNRPDEELEYFRRLLRQF